MTCKEILELESTNTNCIYLHYEGTFLRAYERSAYFAHRYIHEFKVTKTYIKVVNQDVVRVGFPVNVFEKWAHGYVHEWVDEKLAKIEMREPFDEMDYINWKDAQVLNPNDKFTPHTAIIEKTPVYKTAYDYLLQVFTFSKNISKDVNSVVGKQLKEQSYRMCYNVRILYDVPDRNAHIDETTSLCNEILFILQLLKDLREISLNTFVLASERIVSVSKQLSGLRQ